MKYTLSCGAKPKISMSYKGKAMLRGKLKGAQCYEPVKSKVASISLICMKNLRLSSCQRAKLGTRGTGVC